MRIWEEYCIIALHHKMTELRIAIHKKEEK